VYKFFVSINGKSLFGDECNSYWFILQSACRSNFSCISVICTGVLLSASRDNILITLQLTYISRMVVWDKEEGFFFFFLSFRLAPRIEICENLSIPSLLPGLDLDNVGNISSCG
jgi:hypothetical protein